MRTAIRSSGNASRFARTPYQRPIEMFCASHRITGKGSEGIKSSNLMIRSAVVEIGRIRGELGRFFLDRACEPYIPASLSPERLEWLQLPATVPEYYPDQDPDAPNIAATGCSERSPRPTQGRGVREYRQSIQKANERSLAFENGAVDRRGRSQRLVQNQVRDFSLLIAEQLAQRKCILSDRPGRACESLPLYRPGKRRSSTFLLVFVGGAIIAAVFPP